MTYHSVHVRTAVAADAAHLIELNELFDGGPDICRDLATVQQTLSAAGTEVVFVAERNNHLIGFATLQLTYSFCYLRPTAELTGIYVRTAHRQVGTASLLIGALIQYIKEKNALELFIRVNRNNAPAIRLYRKSGFAEASHFEYRIIYYERA